MTMSLMVALPFPHLKFLDCTERRTGIVSTRVLLRACLTSGHELAYATTSPW